MVVNITIQNWQLNMELNFDELSYYELPDLHAMEDTDADYDNNDGLVIVSDLTLFNIRRQIEED